MIGSIRKILWNNYGYLLTKENIDGLSNFYQNNILKENYNFSSFDKKVLTQSSSTGRKRRTVYFFEKASVEYILCEYLKSRLDNEFHIKYSDRNKIIKILFNTLPVLSNLNDYVLVRFDFKSFFDSVSTNFAFNKYIKCSSMNRNDKDIFEKYCSCFKFCFAGLQVSNVMTEIACMDFDKVFRSKLSDFGVVYYERYVDDALIVLNKYINESESVLLLNNTVSAVFEDCKVSINMNKFIYISRRNFSGKHDFDFLGYLFHLEKINTEERKYKYSYGITESKRKKYTSKIHQTFLDYKKDKDMELLRHKIKLLSVRVVYSMIRGEDYCFWITRGIINNYNELRYHLEDIDSETDSFLKNVYYNEMEKLKITIPYFMQKEYSDTENSIYNLYSNLKRYRSIVFDNNVGIKRKDLFRQIHKINPSYKGKKRYYQIVNDYLEFLKMKRHRGSPPMPGCNVQLACNPALITCVDSPKYEAGSTNLNHTY
jgi:hypothetical protein